jgi:hypothetical protein
VAAIIIVIHKTGVINDHCLRVYPTLQSSAKLTMLKAASKVTAFKLIFIPKLLLT